MASPPPRAVRRQQVPNDRLTLRRRRPALHISLEADGRRLRHYFPSRIAVRVRGEAGADDTFVPLSELLEARRIDPDGVVPPARSLSGRRAAIDGVTDPNGAAKREAESRQVARAHDSA